MARRVSNGPPDKPGRGSAGCPRFGMFVSKNNASYDLFTLTIVGAGLKLSGSRPVVGQALTIEMFPGRRYGLIGKAVKIRSGRATVSGKPPALCHCPGSCSNSWDTDARDGKAPEERRSASQETCLGDFGPQLCAVRSRFMAGDISCPACQNQISCRIPGLQSPGIFGCPSVYFPATERNSHDY